MIIQYIIVYYISEKRYTLFITPPSLLLQKKYEEVEVRVRACQQPSEYEQRLAAMEQQLAGIADRVNTANLTPLSSEPAYLQQQLDQCMASQSFYLLHVNKV